YRSTYPIAPFANFQFFSTRAPAPMFTFTNATNFIAKHAFVVMPKAPRKPAATPQMQFAYPLPYGAVLRDGGVQFSVYSKSATGMRLLLYRHVHDREPHKLI